MKNPPLLPSFLALLGIATLSTLGTWQLERLEWKNEIIDNLQTEYQKDADKNPINLKNIDENTTILRGKITGTYLLDKEINIVPRSKDSIPGQNIITPLKLANGEIILVNRGWAPLDWERKQPREKWVRATGVLKKPPRPNTFTPANIPKTEAWYHPKLDEIAKAKNLTNLAPYIFYLESDTWNTKGEYPQSSADQLMPNNNHLQYAIFWYVMAIILGIMFYLRFIKTKP